MKLDEVIISRATIERFVRKSSQNFDLDVAIVGAGGMLFSGEKVARMILERLRSGK